MPKVYHSKESDEWGTPQALFDALHSIHNFTVDAAASKYNHKLAHYYSLESQDFFAQDLSEEIIFCNPPFSRVGKFVPALSKYRAVLLAAARTDTRWFQDYCRECFFLRGRLSFEKDGEPTKHRAPFPAMLVFFGVGTFNAFQSSKHLYPELLSGRAFISRGT